MEKGGRWMVIRRTSGKVVEESTVWVGNNAKPRRARKKGSTTAQKKDENERDAVKRLARIINCNFGYGDLLLTPKYSGEGLAKLEAWAREHQEEGESWEDALLRAAQHQGELYLDRLREVLKAMGITCKGVLVTSDVDGETGEYVRPHHHLVIQRVAFEAAAEKWKLGSVDYRTLKDQDDYTAVAVYMLRQVRRRENGKRWTATRNMDKPLVSTRWAAAGEELRPDARAVLVERNQWEPGKPQYIRFVKRPLPSERQRSGKREYPDSLQAHTRGSSIGKSRQSAKPPKGGGG